MTNENVPPLFSGDIHEYNWMDFAACKGQTHMMFPKEHKDITYIQPARAICAECPVAKDCLEYALEFPPADMHGVWAGMTSRQLAAEQKKRGIRPIRPTLSQMWGD
jgi:WhiB family redox-sensing transcriptional regulator